MSNLSSTFAAYLSADMVNFGLSVYKCALNESQKLITRGLLPLTMRKLCAIKDCYLMSY